MYIKNIKIFIIEILVFIHNFFEYLIIHISNYKILGNKKNKILTFELLCGMFIQQNLRDKIIISTNM